MPTDDPQAPDDEPAVHGAPARTNGRPSKYRPEYDEQARKLLLKGFTDLEIADFFGVSKQTIYNWKAEHPSFLDSKDDWKAVADERVERTLLEKATGYSFDAVKILQNDGVPVIVPYREHVPPSDTAMIFWLKNRKAKEWREMKAVELTGADGGPVQSVGIVTDDPAEAAKAYQRLIEGKDE